MMIGGGGVILVFWILREDSGRVFVSPRVSPTGRFLAFAVWTTDSNAWLLETK
jgi:hypothetical protein